MLDEIAGALTDGDRDRAEGLLERVRGLDGRVRSFNEALSAGYETARLSPTGRRSLKHLELYSGASIKIELSVINTRVLVRGAANVLRRGEVVPPTLPGAIQNLSRAVRALGSYLEESAGPESARLCALEAARGATEMLKERHDLGASVARANAYSAKEDTLLRGLSVLRNDSDANGDPLLTARLVKRTTKGKLTLRANGTFTYKPRANFFGTDSFTYRASDGKSSSNVAKVTIRVKAQPN